MLFASDNGPMSEGGWNRDFFNSSGPLRGGKRNMYEGGIRVPLIAWQPGTITAGETSDHVSAFWDFVPTRVRSGGDRAAGRHRRDLVPPTLHGEGKQPEHDYLYWEFYERREASGPPG